ncbi:MAG: type I glyceraldehyde-3-phosphate dehydrogenase [Candidatus Dojkabacteria bacterium]|nr:type I glyceraldehyde-3-phosphate dehydrogenase [Candidatus Dojkabacteria bacterium]MDQ7020799.1 type I glyceraldehyde-3-phosphate dehydrogenase [Candidatus Dojkabacteria bacterium]
MIKVAINGFGRIGRKAFQYMIERDDIEIVAINDLTDVKTLAHLLKYDSVFGIFNKDVSYKATDTTETLIVAGREYNVLTQPNPEELPWKELNVDVVLECTGRFVKDRAAEAHITAGARRVILSAPSKGISDVKTYVKGVNHSNYNNDEIISNASCTTNCVGPVTAVMIANFGVEKAAMSTIHSYTASQNLADGPHKDLRRTRAAGVNIIPTTSGAAIATTEALPELQGKFDGMAFRIPTICGSITDFTFITKKKTTIEEVNQAFKTAVTNPIYSYVLEVTNEPIVSTDIIGNTSSAIVDLGLTNVIDGDLVKVFAWYDNESGYSKRLVDMIEVVN